MSDEKTDLFHRADEVLGLFRRGAEFTRQLVEENERLRTRLMEQDQRQTEAAQDNDEWGKLRQELLTRIQGLETEKQDVLEKLHELEEENRQFAGRYLEVEEENNNLASLYVASFQLHSTLDLSEVLKIIIEIVINLIGAEVFAVYVLDERSGHLEPVACEGEELSVFPRVPLGQGSIGKAAESADISYGEGAGEGEGGGVQEFRSPVVCIPLRIADRPIGAIAIHSLLQQKDGFSALDRELFTLLAGHAATAIFAAQLYGQSERKLNTIQGFIELLTK